jgi:hypothetical protein
MNKKKPQMKHKADGLYYIDKEVIRKMDVEEGICYDWQRRLRRLCAKQPEGKLIITLDNLSALAEGRDEAGSRERARDMYNKYANLYDLAWYSHWLYGPPKDKMLRKIMNHLARRAKREGKL